MAKKMQQPTNAASSSPYISGIAMESIAVFHRGQVITWRKGDEVLADTLLFAHLSGAAIKWSAGNG